MTDSPDVRNDSPTNQAGGAQIVNVGISERSLLLFFLLPMITGLVVAIMALHGQGDVRAALERSNGDVREANARLEGEVSTLAAEAKAAKEIAQISERNAKLAQYQLKLALDRAKIEVPDDLTENDK